MDQNSFNDALTIANKKHDIVAVQIYDKRETEMPAVGLIKVKDAETDERIWINTNDNRLRKIYSDMWTEKQLLLQQTFQKSKIDNVSIDTDEDYVKALIRLFKLRN